MEYFIQVINNNNDIKHNTLVYELATYFARIIEQIESTTINQINENDERLNLNNIIDLSKQYKSTIYNEFEDTLIELNNTYNSINYSSIRFEVIFRKTYYFHKDTFTLHIINNEFISNETIENIISIVKSKPKIECNNLDKYISSNTYGIYKTKLIRLLNNVDIQNMINRIRELHEVPLIDIPLKHINPFNSCIKQVDVDSNSDSDVASEDLLQYVSDESLGPLSSHASGDTLFEAEQVRKDELCRKFCKKYKDVMKQHRLDR